MNPTTDHAPATRQRRKETRPQELLDAALALFVEKGFAATRTEEVAQRAGVSKGTLYLYYASKEELFKAMVRQNLGSLIAEGQARVDNFAGSSSELLGMLMSTWWERVGSTPAAGIHKVVVAEVRNFPDLAQFYADEVMQPADRLFTSVVQRGISRGEFRSLPVHEVAHALLAPMIFMALHQHSLGACPVQGCAHIDPASALRTHLQLMLGGLEVSPRPGPGQGQPELPAALPASGCTEPRPQPTTRTPTRKRSSTSTRRPVRAT
jgi:AcrR family transcriptional regulator